MEEDDARRGKRWFPLNERGTPKTERKGFPQFSQLPVHFLTVPLQRTYRTRYYVHRVAVPVIDLNLKTRKGERRNLRSEDGR